jgi:hydrogenase maturation protease
VITGSGISTVVIGVGNEFRSDDGVGPAVAAEIGRRGLPGTRVVLSDGEPASLLEAWDGADLAVVVDAVRVDPPTPGRIHRSDAGPWLHGGNAATSHGLGVPEALLLGRALDRLPGRLVVFAVEAASLDLGAGMSPPVAAAVGPAVTAVLAELGAGSGGP